MLTNSQKLNVELSETRSTLNELIEKRNKLPEGQEPSSEDIQSMDTSTKKIRELEVRYRAEMTKEGNETNNEEAMNTKFDKEEREKRRLIADASIMPFIVESIDNKKLEGREAEVRSAVLGNDHGGQMPLDMLLDPTYLEHRALFSEGKLEHRVDVVTPVAAAALADGSQAAIAERVFTRTVASRLGVAIPTVPVGAAVYPIMTSGTAAEMAADGTAVDATAAAFTGHNLDPIRVSAAYLFNVRQTLQLRDFENVLRRDLTALIADKMDDQVINGDGAAPNVNGFLNELPNAAGTSAATNFGHFLAHFTGRVDGINAYNLSDLRAIVGKDSFAQAYSVYRGTNSDVPAYEHVAERVSSLSVSNRIPDKDSNDKQDNIMALSSYPGRNAVMPVWRGLDLIRDVYTNAASGQIRLTAVAFFNFKILRETGWHLFKVQTA